MIMVSTSTQLLLILIISTKFKVFHCQDRDDNSIDFEPVQFARRLPKHIHRHHQRQHIPEIPQEDIELTQELDQFHLPVGDPEDYDAPRVRQFLLTEDDRWPRFEDIERLAGVSEWKKERWKVEAQGSTESPHHARIQKFTYRRVQGGASGKRNAIIAVSAVMPVRKE